MPLPEELQELGSSITLPSPPRGARHLPAPRRGLREGPGPCGGGHGLLLLSWEPWEAAALRAFMRPGPSPQQQRGSVSPPLPPAAFAPISAHPLYSSRTNHHPEALGPCSKPAFPLRDTRAFNSRVLGPLVHAGSLGA